MSNFINAKKSFSKNSKSSTRKPTTTSKTSGTQFRTMKARTSTRNSKKFGTDFPTKEWLACCTPLSFWNPLWIKAYATVKKLTALSNLCIKTAFKPTRTHRCQIWQTRPNTFPSSPGRTLVISLAWNTRRPRCQSRWKVCFSTYRTPWRFLDKKCHRCLNPSSFTCIPTKMSLPARPRKNTSAVLGLKNRLRRGRLREKERDMD